MFKVTKIFIRKIQKSTNILNKANIFSRTPQTNSAPPPPLLKNTRIAPVYSGIGIGLQNPFLKKK